MNKSVFIFLTLMLVAASQTSLAARIQASVDRNPVSLGESFQLIFTATETPDDEPDCSPLEQDFDILNQSQSHQTQWINGDFNRTVSWTLVLMAKRTGQLNIPSIAFGKDRSNALRINVVQQAVPDEERDLFVTAEVDKQAPYVQAQVIYTLRFYRKVAIAQASLDEPQLEDAVIERLGEDKNFDTAIRGVRYRVTERKYAIFPQQSGPQTIAPVSLTAEVISGRRSRFGFFGSQMTVTKRLKSQAIRLQVKPVPDNYHGHWLPAEQVVLKDDWSADSFSIKVGEPLTRALTLLAKGVTDSQLPKLWPEVNIDGLNQYPDQPVLREQKKPDGIIAFREEKIALIPSKPGEYELPAVKLRWFNSQTEQEEELSLPAIKIKAIAVSQNSPAPVDKPRPSAPISSEVEEKAVDCPVVSTQQPAQNTWLWPAVAAFLAGAWLITLVYFLRRPSSQKNAQETSKNEQGDLMKAAIKSLKQACFANDPTAAKEALLKWGQLAFGVSSLSGIKDHCEARLRDQIDVLMESLYAPNAKKWHGKALYQAFVESVARQKVQAAQESTDLKPLYKIRFKS